MVPKLGGLATHWGGMQPVFTFIMSKDIKEKSNINVEYFLFYLVEQLLFSVFTSTLVHYLKRFVLTCIISVTPSDDTRYCSLLLSNPLVHAGAQMHVHVLCKEKQMNMYTVTRSM